MRPRLSLPVSLSVLLGVTALLCGCAGAPEVGLQPIFYPANQPRVQFLLTFSDAERWTERRSSFAEFVVGAKQVTESEIKNPYGVAARNGRIYVCDLGAHRIHVIDIPTRTYSVLGTPEQVVNPVNVTIAADGTKYVCDTGRRLVLVFDAEDRFIRSMEPPRGAVPIDLALWQGELIIADVEGATVQVWSAQGEHLRDIAQKGVGPADLRMPTNLDVGPDGSIFVTDTELAMVKVYDQQGSFLRSIGQPGDRPGNFARPKGIAVDGQGRVYVADGQWGVVQLFTADGQGLLVIPENPAEAVRDALLLPTGVAIDSTSLEQFRQFVSPTFVPEYLLFVASQFGPLKIGVYAFGHAQGSPAE